MGSLRSSVVERSHGKGKVFGSNPTVGTQKKDYSMIRRLNISFKAFEPSMITKASSTVYKLCAKLECKSSKSLFFTPVGFPVSRKYFTVLRSPHVHKKSREQFVMSRRKTQLNIDPSLDHLFQSSVLFACKHVVMRGVQIQISARYSSGLYPSRK